MGIIRTDKWLKKDFDDPILICEKLLPYFDGYTAKEIYQQLLNYGMYRPSGLTKRNFAQMLDYKAWDLAGDLLNQYKEKWSGPDLPVFLFPLDEKGSLFRRREESNKSGVSFPDKMFLFLSNYEDYKEIEALLVHEYHHVCRLKALNKRMNQYTLLDSIIIEGLAEYAVYKHCGEEYLSSWCHMYSKRELSNFWDHLLIRKLAIKKNEKEHEHFLYGGRGIPPMIGYAMGYFLVSSYYKKHPYTAKSSFGIDASQYIIGKA